MACPGAGWVQGCIKFWEMCDGIQHCPDGSDEDEQYCESNSCENFPQYYDWAFQCESSTRCIWSYYLGDSIPDCPGIHHFLHLSIKLKMSLFGQVCQYYNIASKPFILACFLAQYPQKVVYEQILLIFIRKLICTGFSLFRIVPSTAPNSFERRTFSLQHCKLRSAFCMENKATETSEENSLLATLSLSLSF